MKIRLDQIIPDPEQPRKTFKGETLRELGASYKALGLIQPITVRPYRGKYMIIVGERRYRATLLAGLEEIECIIRKDTDDKKAREMQFAENYCLEPLNAYEQAEAWSSHIKNYNITAVMFAKSIGVSEITVRTNLTLVNHLHPDLKNAILEGTLTKSHAEVIAPIVDYNRQIEIARQIIEGNIGGRKADEYIKQAKNLPNHPAESIAIQVKYAQEIGRANGQIILNELKRQRIEVPKLPQGQFRTIVIDPPWEIEKILRDCRPNQFDIDYPTMTLDEIANMPIPELAFQEGCHIYLWTTHKHLPDAFNILEAWGANYECLLTWVKNVGFTPFSWMYSTEHCLFARIGNLPLLKLGKRLDFQAKVREHSRKPDEFYDLIKEVSPEPRLDWFGREPRNGFQVYGNEPNKFAKTETLNEVK